MRVTRFYKMFWIHFLFIGTSYFTSERKIYCTTMRYIESQEEHKGFCLTKPFPQWKARSALTFKPSPGVVRQRPQHLCHEQAALQRTPSLRKSGCKDCKDGNLGLSSVGTLILRWFNWHWTHALCYLLMKSHSMDWERNIAIALSVILVYVFKMFWWAASCIHFTVIKMKGNPNLFLFCWEWFIGFPPLGLQY